jgi:UDP-glucose 4-epimerase
VDAVIHMASYTSVEESVKSPLKYIQNNVLGAATLLEAMRAAGVKKIIFSSSATVYGTPKSLPITEDQPISAANPYGASKIAVEALCESFAKTDGFDVIILRYFNPYGPGEKHLPETHAIPNFIKAALEKRPIPLYWKGEQVRDFIYVEDLAAAHIAVLPLSGYHVFNVGTKAGTKIIDVVNELSDIFGYKLEIDYKGDRPGDVMATYASSEKLNQTTGWETKVSLKEGLSKTINFFKNQ